MSLTPTEKAEVLAEYRRVKSPFKVAKNLKMPVADVWAVIEENPDAAAQNIERWDGEGRPDLRRYFVAQTRCSQNWDNDDPNVAAARAAYEAGTHDMATHRDGGFKFLCLFPLRRKRPRPDYFKPEPAL